MTKLLANAVHLTDASGIVHSFMPGTKPPKWARALITNPKAWATVAEPAGTDDGTENDDAPTEPPADDAAATSGDVPKKNASTADWHAYADAKGFEIDKDATRKDIIAALEANGVPTA